MTDLKLETLVGKLSLAYSKDEMLKIIWGWIKQDHITLTQFKSLIDYVNTVQS